MIKHHFADGLYIREQTLKSGEKVQKHIHDYEHLSYLVSGECVLEYNGRMEHFKAPATILVRKNISHKVHAITDIVWLCIHNANLADPDMQIVE